MRTRAVLTSIFASASVLLIGWQAGAAGQAATTGATTTSTANGSAATGVSTAVSSGGATATDGTYTGDDVNTRFGSVQVAVTISGGAITDVTELQLTDSDRRSVQISNRASPLLASEVLASQSAAVQTISGATYTSDAYLQSVQSALDQAGL